MSIFAIADTHLSFGTDKPMDSFPGWNDYVERIEKNWNKIDTIKILSNNSYSVENVSICGSRGWLFDINDEHDEKVLNREVGRLKMSLDSAECENKIVFLHYPPITTDTKCEEILNLLKEYGIKKCYYGHLHGIAAKMAIDDTVDGIEFRLVSCDRLSFTPKLIR